MPLFFVCGIWTSRIAIGPIVSLTAMSSLCDSRSRAGTELFCRLTTTGSARVPSGRVHKKLSRYRETTKVYHSCGRGRAVNLIVSSTGSIAGCQTRPTLQMISSFVTRLSFPKKAKIWLVESKIVHSSQSTCLMASEMISFPFPKEHLILICRPHRICVVEVPPVREYSQSIGASWIIRWMVSWTVSVWFTLSSNPLKGVSSHDGVTWINLPGIWGGESGGITGISAWWHWEQCSW